MHVMIYTENVLTWTIERTFLISVPFCRLREKTRVSTVFDLRLYLALTLRRRLTYIPIKLTGFKSKIEPNMQ